jgi:hypothetical protein
MQVLFGSLCPALGHALVVVLESITCVDAAVLFDRDARIGGKSILFASPIRSVFDIAAIWDMAMRPNDVFSSGSRVGSDKAGFG